ncbi:MAG: MotA/TolQ/ExbB proton channel family protein [Chlamydiia bacterium]
MASIYIFVSAFKDSDGFGKIIFLLLFSLSFLSWFILIYKAREYYKIEKQMTYFIEKFDLGDGIVLEKSFAEHLSDSPLFHLYKSFKQCTEDLMERNQLLDGVKEHFLTAYDIGMLQNVLKQKVQQTNKKLNNNLFILATAISLAPFLGILGTVWGLLVSLSGLGKGLSALSNQVVMGGLSTALATTVIGLLIAIPALIGYNYLKTKLKEMTQTMLAFSSSLVHEVEIGFRRD